MNAIPIKNNQTLKIQDIPVFPYEEFLELNTGMASDVYLHCVNYFGHLLDDHLRLYCCMADDTNGNILISSAVINPGSGLPIPSFTARHFAFHVFERELHENFGIQYTDHPWLKPLRYSHNRADLHSEIGNYPFYRIESEELHEVGVGPIHAGIIEPGHFRFICNGEQILHLEIQLGFQHRGIEQLFPEKKTLLQRNILAENIAGDTVIGHTVAFADLWESLCDFKAGDDILYARTIASELERIAIHTGDLSAICTDVAYQLGSAVFGRLRTPVINTFQVWCGNRLAKSLIRAGRNPYPVTPDIADALNRLFDAYEPDLNEMYQRMKTLPSVLARLERTGTVTQEQAERIGAVGPAARTSGLIRDIRWTHPYLRYGHIPHQPIVKHHGDVYSRTQIRKQEISQSIRYIRNLIGEIPGTGITNSELKAPMANAFVLSLTEGWRGEICHCAITDSAGDLILYKIKDPSLHNWTALALAVRNNDISDFPICNKSFNLSYCGHDL
ncbi:MAG: NADH-quinone oxidoreductase subunit C [Bacteroidales bacterium]|nr:NADH-quinone oxidoreductase subunit C [Bacteroidales bacterium]